MTIMQKINYLRIMNKFSLRTIAKESGVPKSTLCNYTSGKVRNLRERNRVKLELYLNTFEYNKI